MNSRQFSLELPFAIAPPSASALFRSVPEDFQVTEQLGFELSGEGEHLCLYVEKRGQNTRWVAGLLAKQFGVDDMAVGHCGMKDRHAVTRQWFSVHLPGKLPETSEQFPLLEGCQVLAQRRHHKKLRRGQHAGNQFVIRLRRIEGDVPALEHSLKQAVDGVPNYFGEQRFGRAAGNLVEANRLLSVWGDTPSSRMQRSGRRGQRSPVDGIYLSAARAYLFNLVLAKRVSLGYWKSPMPGETAPEGPLWGRGRSAAPQSVQLLEDQILGNWRDWTNSLEYSGLQQERRSLLLIPANMQYRWLNHDDCTDLVLSFDLPSGCFATSVLRELVSLQSIGGDGAV
jgi:tRNA pseudouridine13 synthase